MGAERKRKNDDEIANLTNEMASRARNGDQEALRALCERIHVRLQRFCRRLVAGNEQLAQDLSQDAFIKVLEHIQDLDDTRNFTGWLFRVTKNLFLDHVRSAGERHRGGPLDAEREIGSNVSPLVRPQVDRKLAVLAPEDRWVLLLVCLEGATYAEAASATGLSEEAIRSRLYRLRKQFTEKDFTDLTRL